MRARWIPNMAEFEVRVVFDERNAQTKSDSFTGNGFST